LKKGILIVVCVLFFCSIQAQRYQYGRVSDDEVKQTRHNIDPEAPAAVLYKKISTKLIYEDTWYYIHQVEARLKIYNENGFNQAVLNIPLYIGEDAKRDVISNVKANTFNYENGKISRERLRDVGRFEEEITENWNVYNIAFPSVKSGSVVEYSYQIKSPYINAFPKVTFQGDIPHNYVEYETEIPDFFGYNVYQNGYVPIENTQKLTVGHITLRNSLNNRSSQALGVGGASTVNVQYTSVLTTFTATDVPKLEKESFVNNIQNYTASISYELSWSEVPGNNRTNYAQTWEDVAQSIYKDKRFGAELNNTNFLNQPVENLIKNEDNLLNRIDLILNNLKSKVKWDGKYGYFPKRSLEESYTQQVGNVAEINLLLIAMLRKAGFNANPVLLSTRSNGIALFPTRTGFNYLICAVQINNQTILLDATETFSDQNVLPERALNWFGRLIKGDFSVEEVNLMPGTIARNITNLNVEVLEGGFLNGKARNAFTGNLALRKRIELSSLGSLKLEEHLENKYQSLDIENLQVQNLENTKDALSKTFDFKSSNSYDKIGDIIYLNPLFFFTTTTNPFKNQERNYPIDLSFPFTNTISVNIETPQGYEIQSIPNSTNIELPNNIGGFSMIFSENEGTIQVRYNLELRVSILPAKDYKMIKDFYETIIEKQSENIILKKTL
jgi:hypothetical protein